MREPEHLLRLLARHGASRVRHSGRTLIDHLYNVHLLLCTWGQREAIVLAGLIHSAYGESDGEGVFSNRCRSAVRVASGEEAEALAFTYSRSRSVLWSANIVFGANYPLLERRDLLAIDVANFIEQLPYVAERDDSIAQEVRSYLAQEFLPKAARADLRRLFSSGGNLGG